MREYGQRIVRAVGESALGRPEIFGARKHAVHDRWCRRRVGESQLPDLGGAVVGVNLRIVGRTRFSTPNRQLTCLLRTRLATETGHLAYTT